MDSRAITQCISVGRVEARLTGSWEALGSKFRRCRVLGTGSYRASELYSVAESVWYLGVRIARFKTKSER